MIGTGACTYHRSQDQEGNGAIKRQEGVVVVLWVTVVAPEEDLRWFRGFESICSCGQRVDMQHHVRPGLVKTPLGKGAKRM